MAAAETMKPLDTLQGSGLSGYYQETEEDEDIPTFGALPRTLRLTPEERLEREVTRRRELELERRVRIFDAKRRTIGVDKEALDAQVAERQRQRELEKQQRHVGDADLLAVDRHLKQAEAEKRRLRKEMERECREFSAQNLSKERATTFDLNDKTALRKCIPARLGDDDPRCGPASMQKFNGEDLCRAERIHQQQKQMRNFIEQQKFEKAMLANEGGDDDDRLAEEVRQIIDHCNHIEENEHRLRREMQKIQQHTNLMTAAELARQKTEKQRQNMQQNAAELEHNATDPFLNETMESRDARGRPRKAEYKGSTREERLQGRAILEEQAAQQQTLRFVDQIEDRKHAVSMEAARRQLVLAEREKQRFRRAAAEQVARQNYDQLRLEHLESTKLSDRLFTNHVGEEFFGKFNLGTR